MKLEHFWATETFGTDNDVAFKKRVGPLFVGTFCCCCAQEHNSKSPIFESRLGLAPNATIAVGAVSLGINR